jgi:hypothetical protein
MHRLDQPVLGGAILTLLALLVIVKRLARHLVPFVS